MLQEVTRIVEESSDKLVAEAIGLTGLCAAIVAALFLPALF